jgi:hypothetical protein
VPFINSVSPVKIRIGLSTFYLYVERKMYIIRCLNPNEKMDLVPFTSRMRIVFLLNFSSSLFIVGQFIFIILYFFSYLLITVFSKICMCLVSSGFYRKINLGHLLSRYIHFFVVEQAGAVDIRQRMH